MHNTGKIKHKTKNMGKIKNMKEGAKRWGRTVDKAVVEEVDLEQRGKGIDGGQEKIRLMV